MKTQLYNYYLTHRIGIKYAILVFGMIWIAGLSSLMGCGGATGCCCCSCGSSGQSDATFQIISDNSDCAYGIISPYPGDATVNFKVTGKALCNNTFVYNYSFPSDPTNSYIFQVPDNGDYEVVTAVNNVSKTCKNCENQYCPNGDVSKPQWTSTDTFDNNCAKSQVYYINVKFNQCICP